MHSIRTSDSIQRDPRKSYALKTRNCDKLSITQKLYHPECRKQATIETPINPRPYFSNAW